MAGERSHDWMPIPDATAVQIGQLEIEATHGNMEHVVQKANTILTSPSTLLVGEMVRINGSEVNFQVDANFSEGEDIEQYVEYESIYEKPYVIGRFMGCVALRDVSGVRELGCELSVETHTGGFLAAYIPLNNAHIDIDTPDASQDNDEERDDEAAAEAEAAANEHELGESFRYLKEHVGEDAQEALSELEDLIYNDVDFLAGESEVVATGLHIRAIGVCSTQILNQIEVAQDPTALRALHFIIEANILDVGESYDIIGLTSDTVLDQGLLFAENVNEVHLRDMIFVGVKLYSASYDIIDDSTVHADGTCTPALLFESPVTGDVFDVQLLRVAQLQASAETYDDEPHDSWRQRYDKYIQDQGR